MEDREYEVLRTYARAWQTEIIMYHLFGIPLWFPISLRQAGFFMAGLSLTFTVSRFIPGIKEIPLMGDPIILYIVTPFLIMKFFTQMTLDGKPPHVFFKDQLLYLIESKEFNMYKPIEQENEIIYSTNIGFRILKSIPSIDLKFFRKELKN